MEWLNHGVLTGSLQRASSETVLSLMGPDPENLALLSGLLETGHGQVVDREPLWSKRAVEGILNGEVHSYGRASDEPTSAIDVLSRVLGFLPETWESLSNWWVDGYATLRTQGEVSDETERCWLFLDVFREHLIGDQTRWWSSLASWDEVVEALRKTWGERWAAVELAIVAAGIASSSDRGSLGDGLFDNDHSLCERARYARLRAGASTWWGRRLAEAPTRFDEMFIVALFFAWGSKKTLTSAVQPFDEWLHRASDLERRQIQAAAFRRAPFDSQQRRSASTLDLDVLGSHINPETVVLLMTRVGSDIEQLAITDRYLAEYIGDDHTVLRVLVHSELAAAEQDPRRWPKALEAFRRAYVSGVASPGNIRQPFAGSSLPYNLARSVVNDADSYPLSIVDIAEKVCRQEVGLSVEAISDIAAEQDW